MQSSNRFLLFGLPGMMSGQDKRHFHFKLIPPRPTFPYDMTKEEKELTDKHGVCCRQEFDAGKLLLYGPVMAPQGAFGLGVLEVVDEAEARRFGANDPSVRAGLQRFELHPMQVAASRARS